MRTAAYASVFLFIATWLLILAAGCFKNHWIPVTEKCHLIPWNKTFPGYMVLSSRSDPIYFGTFAVSSEEVRSRQSWIALGILFEYSPAAELPYWRFKISLWYPLLLFGVLPATFLPGRLRHALREQCNPLRWPEEIPKCRFSLFRLVTVAGLLPVTVWLGFTFVPYHTLLAALTLCSVSAAISVAVGGFVNELRQAVVGAMIGALIIYLVIVGLGFTAQY